MKIVSTKIVKIYVPTYYRYKLFLLTICMMFFDFMFFTFLLIHVLTRLSLNASIMRELSNEYYVEINLVVYRHLSMFLVHLFLLYILYYQQSDNIFAFLCIYLISVIYIMFFSFYMTKLLHKLCFTNSQRGVVHNNINAYK